MPQRGKPDKCEDSGPASPELEVTGPQLAAPVQLPGSDFRIRADGSAIEPITGSTHTFGFALTEAGDRFTVTTTVPGIYMARWNLAKPYTDDTSSLVKIQCPVLVMHDLKD